MKSFLNEDECRWGLAMILKRNATGSTETPVRTVQNEAGKSQDLASPSLACTEPETCALLTETGK